MATTNDIDTKSAVRKFLETRTVVDREDGTSDSADEVQAVLEAVALSFLLYPQAALSFVLRAKNVLQQIVSTDRDIVDFMLKAIDDVENPDDPVTDISDLIEAQTALVEVDRLGRVADDVLAYDRYNQAINRFLDKKLAKSLKRHKRNELERTGTEAKQDLFRVLSSFAPTHDLMVSRLELLLDGVSNFQSVALTRIVSTKALSKVRSSLKKVIQGLQRQQLSKTATAIELLSGSSALSSISNTRKIYDPTIATTSLPTGRTITVSSERVPAIAKGNGSAASLGAIATPWVFDTTINGTNFQVTLPYVGASSRSYVKAQPETGGATFNISAQNRTLYVQFDGIAPPANEPAMVRAVTLPTGPAVTLAAILSALNHVSSGLIDGTAVEMAPGNGRILIYGSASVTRIVVRQDFHGDFDVDGNYVPAAGSVHSTLGFLDDQTSGDPEVFTPEELIDFLEPHLTNADVSVEDGIPTIATTSTDLLTTLSFGAGVADEFGFSAGPHIANPSYLELTESEAIDPTSVGVYIGSLVSAVDAGGLTSRSLLANIANIDGTKLTFSPGVLLPRCSKANVRITSPLVAAIQSLLDTIRPFRNNFEDDARDLQRVLSPLLSRPTLAQINDAKRGLQAVRDKVNDLLSALSGTVVRTDRAEFEEVANQITSSLTERGIDRGLELLQSCQFSAFFDLTKEEASKGTWFLKASGDVGRNELAQTTIEQDLEDLEPKGTTPDENLLPGEELLEDEEQI